MKGLFKTTGIAEPHGHGVTLVFVGEDAAIQFSGGTTFNFITMDYGPLADFPFFFDHSASISNKNDFSGNSNIYFESIMVFGERDVTVTGDSEVNSGSPLSVIAAREITLNGNGTLFFNLDEENTLLPIPDTLSEKKRQRCTCRDKKGISETRAPFQTVGRRSEAERKFIQIR